MNIVDLARSVNPDAKHKIIGIRPGEKIHEEMIAKSDSLYTFEYDNYFKILPNINNWHKDERRIKEGKSVEEGFSYTSDSNKDWMSIETLQEWIRVNYDQIDKN